MSYLTIVKLKGAVSIQDLGRNTSQHLGFSGSGAADEYSYSLANKLLNNDLSAAALEVTLGQMSLRANSHCKLVITGADCQSTLEKEHRKIIPVPNNQVFTLTKGDVISLSIPKKMLHSYIAISGGFASKKWLNSASQTINEIGLNLGEDTLTIGKTLCFSPSAQQKTLDELNSEPHLFHSPEQLTLRFIPSALWLSLTKEKQQILLENTYQISAESNRMGYRLKGDNIFLNSQKNRLSKPVSYGAIQLPNDGQPIVLMKERQTIGGYPVLGTVIQTDLFRFSQKRPGESIRFVPVSLEQAQAQLLAFRSKFNQQLKSG
jgi:biotin-dependent carboxylase-like uncharacterized protein